MLDSSTTSSPSASTAQRIRSRALKGSSAAFAVAPSIRVSCVIAVGLAGTLSLNTELASTIQDRRLRSTPFARARVTANARDGAGAAAHRDDVEATGQPGRFS